MNKELIEVPVKIMKNGKLPEYAHQGDSGMDVYVAEDIFIPAGSTMIVKTAIKVAIPEGYEIQIRPRSGISLKHRLRVVNAPGTVDASYRNEVGVLVENTSPSRELLKSIGNGTLPDSYEFGKIYVISKDNAELTNHFYQEGVYGDYTLKKGDRIAQFVLAPIINCLWKEVDSVADIGFDRQGGWGSSGVR